MTRYFDDVTVGESHDLGEVSFSEADIIAFGEEYDPLPFHVDPEAAAEQFFGGVVASGWQTAATCYGVVAREFLANTSVVAGRGVDEMRLHRPVRPGDVLAVHAEVVETRSEPNPDHGLVRIRIEADLQAGGHETGEVSGHPLALSMEILPIFTRDGVEAGAGDAQ
jgi:acyl dehydratase